MCKRQEDRKSVRVSLTRNQEQFTSKNSSDSRYSFIQNYVNDYPEANELFVRKLVELHFKLCQTAGSPTILDEGLFQYITSIPFDKEIIVDEAFVKIMEVAGQIQTLVFDCQCPIDTAIYRLRSRERIGENKYGRYYDLSDDVIKSKLRVKQHNIDTVLSMYSGQVVTIDMQQPIDVNVSIVKNNIDKVFPFFEEKLWLT